MRLRLLPLLLLAACPAPARAGCEVDGRPVSFGEVDPARGGEGVGEVVVSCDAGTAFEVALEGDRQLRSANGGRMRYEIYADAGHHRAWGDGGGTGEVRAGTTDGKGEARLSAYGVLPAQPSSLPGDYSDQIVITLRF